jgi:hypothetical protein
MAPYYVLARQSPILARLEHHSQQYYYGYHFDSAGNSLWSGWWRSRADIRSPSNIKNSSRELGVEFAWARKRGLLSEPTCKASGCQIHQNKGSLGKCRGWTENRGRRKETPRHLGIKCSSESIYLRTDLCHVVCRSPSCP